MRIAYVCADQGVPVFGRKGASIHVQEMVRALTAQGARLELFAANVGGGDPVDLDQVIVHPLPAVSGGDRAAREQAALAVNPAVRAALDREGAFDLVYERYSLWSFAGMEHAWNAGVPGLLEVNAPLVEEQARYRGLVDRAAAERVAERVFGAATVLVALSREIASYLDGYPAARGRVHVVPNAVNPDRFRPALEPLCPASPGTFTVGFVGSLKPWHGLAVLVEAFVKLHERVPRTRLVIVGDGPEKERLVDAVSSRGVADAVQFSGAVAPNDVPRMLASMDVAVAPYPQLDHFYFSPLKVYEYMAAGLPIVSSRIGQLVDLIEDGVTGLLCPPGDATALAAALHRLLVDPNLRQRLGRAAREAVLCGHTWDVTARRVLSLALPTAAAHHGLGGP